MLKDTVCKYIDEKNGCSVDGEAKAAHLTSKKQLKV